MDSSNKAPQSGRDLASVASPFTTPNRSYGSAESLEDFKFTFEYYLDHSQKIDADSCHSGDDSFGSVSLPESVREFNRENGRTYHAYRAGSYFFPNDEPEVERLNYQHEVIKILLDSRNYLAPWSQRNPPHKVLDIATGTGLWAVEMGDEFPQAEIIGLDLSPIQPEHVPPNVSFYVDDATDDWPQNDRDFDYIHTRVTLGCWEDMASQIIKKAFERLRPGGWMESQEPMGHVEYDSDSKLEASVFRSWSEGVANASRAVNRPVDIAVNLKRWYIEAGFVDVQEKVYKIPLNGWPKEQHLKRFGEMWHRNLDNGLAAFSYALFHRVYNMTKEQIEVSLVDVRKELADHRFNMYQKFYVVWGRKPETVSPAGLYW